MFGCCRVLQDEVWLARQAMAALGVFGRGKVRLARFGDVGRGDVRLGRIGMVRTGGAS